MPICLQVIAGFSTSAAGYEIRSLGDNNSPTDVLLEKHVSSSAEKRESDDAHNSATS